MTLLAPRGRGSRTRPPGAALSREAPRPTPDQQAVAREPRPCPARPPGRPGLLAAPPWEPDFLAFRGANVLWTQGCHSGDGNRVQVCLPRCPWSPRTCDSTEMARQPEIGAVAALFALCRPPGAPSPGDVPQSRRPRSPRPGLRLPHEGGTSVHRGSEEPAPVSAP